MRILVIASILFLSGGPSTAQPARAPSATPAPQSQQLPFSADVADFLAERTAELNREAAMRQAQADRRIAEQQALVDATLQRAAAVVKAIQDIQQKTEALDAELRKRLAEPPPVREPPPPTIIQQNVPPWAMEPWLARVRDGAVLVMALLASGALAYAVIRSRAAERRRQAEAQSVAALAAATRLLAMGAARKDVETAAMLLAPDLIWALNQRSTRLHEITHEHPTVGPFGPRLREMRNNSATELGLTDAEAAGLVLHQARLLQASRPVVMPARVTVPPAQPQMPPQTQPEAPQPTPTMTDDTVQLTEQMLVRPTPQPQTPPPAQPSPRQRRTAKGVAASGPVDRRPPTNPTEA